MQDWPGGSSPASRSQLPKCVTRATVSPSGIARDRYPGAFVEPMDAVRRDLYRCALLRDATLEDANEYERLGCPAGLVGLGGKGAFPRDVAFYNRCIDLARHFSHNPLLWDQLRRGTTCRAPTPRKQAAADSVISAQAAIHLRDESETTGHSQFLVWLGKDGCDTCESKL